MPEHMAEAARAKCFVFRVCLCGVRPAKLCIARVRVGLLKDHVNIRILPSMISGIPSILGLGTGM